MERFQKTLDRILPVNGQVMAKTQERLDDLTKPRGSLGVMETIARKIAGITNEVKPGIMKKTNILMAGDHGVVEEGVSAYPQEVTPQMVMNFINGGAAMNVLSRHAGSELIIVDMGVASDLPDMPMLIKRKVARGTANMCKGPAMTREQALEALEIGIEVVEECIDRGTGLVGIGEMGIGNTTPSTAIISLYARRPVAEVVGRGTGVDDGRLLIKIDAVKRAIEINKPDLKDPLEVLAKVGGLEIAGLTGVILGAGARRVPVVIDGFISGAAAVIASQIKPVVKDYLIASHLSEEPGHKVMLEHLGIEPMLYMNMRLGEGTGAALAMNIIDASLKILNEMSTFSDAGVSEATDKEIPQ